MTKLLLWGARQECHHTTREPHQPAKNKLVAAGPRPGSLGPEEKLVGRHTRLVARLSTKRKKTLVQATSRCLTPAAHPRMRRRLPGEAGRPLLALLNLKPRSERARNSGPCLGAWAEDSSPRELSTNILSLMLMCLRIDLGNILPLLLSLLSPSSFRAWQGNRVPLPRTTDALASLTVSLNGNKPM